MFEIETIEVSGGETLYQRANSDMRSAGGDVKIGSGAYAQVYSNRNDPGMVMKMCYASDPGYLGYLKAIHSNKNESVHLPKIYWMKRYIRKDCDLDLEYYLVGIEKLSQARMCNTTMIWRDNFLTTFIALTSEESWTVFDSIPFDYASITGDIINAIDVLDKAKRDAVAHLDLHIGNIMKRSDGTPVITDPLN